MKDLEEYSIKEIELYKKISVILRQEWNPIGLDDVLPLDEYDSYIPFIIEIINSKKKITNKKIKLTTYLKHIEYNNIDFIPKKIFYKLKRNYIIYKVSKKILNLE